MSGYENKNSGKSIRAKLLNVAKKENVFYQTILTRYFQERLLHRLSKTRFRGNFYLKGGALMYAYERFAARPTLDIDLLGCDIRNDCVAMVSIFREICWLNAVTMLWRLMWSGFLRRISQSLGIIMACD